MISGLTVAIVALPLSMAIAIASGVTPDRGLYTAVVGGFIVSLLGGSRFQIGGPAGAQTPSLVANGTITFGLSATFPPFEFIDNGKPAAVARFASGGTVAYAYFPNKEALFLAAVDDDAAGVIQEGLATVLDVPDVRRWHDTLIFSLVDAVERHPLARRLLAGLEPEVTVRVLEIPALNELRKACTEMLRTGQAAGTVRSGTSAVSGRPR